MSMTSLKTLVERVFACLAVVPLVLVGVVVAPFIAAVNP